MSIRAIVLFLGVVWCAMVHQIVVGESSEFSEKCGGSRVCKLPLDSGPCEALMMRYGFDQALQSCRQFNYGGCQGNANSFATLAECEKACGGSACSLPFVFGPCKALTTRYGFDPAQQKCVEFKYGGCGGNGNNFVSLKACESSCGIV